MRGSWLALTIIAIGVASLLILFLVMATRRRSLKNYTDPDGPYYEGRHAEGGAVFDGYVKVVSWNINFSERIDEAIETLAGVEALQDADILLLQEMDASGVEQVAQNLGYDYIYYPASIHVRHGRDFGNAILSRWPISHPSKVILPNTFPMTMVCRG